MEDDVSSVWSVGVHTNWQIEKDVTFKWTFLELQWHTHTHREKVRERRKRLVYIRANRNTNNIETEREGQKYSVIEGKKGYENNLKFECLL